MPDDHDNPLIDPYLRRRQILDDLRVDGSTLNGWVEDGTFPTPEILNPGSSREIPVWRSSTYKRWKDARPKRLPKPISVNSYLPEARAKGAATRAQRAAERAQKNGGHDD